MYFVIKRRFLLKLSLWKWLLKIKLIGHDNSVELFFLLLAEKGITCMVENSRQNHL